jgi:hypothetical protein
VAVLSLPESEPEARVIRFRIKVSGLAELQNELRSIRAEQIPFATALTLTRLVQDAQQFVREGVLPLKFTLRRVSWAKQGVRITPATKTRWVASVQDINRYMELQETGGEKIPYKNFIAVPLEGARPTERAMVAPENRPHAVMQRGGFIRDGIMYAVVFRAGRRGRVARSITGISKAASWSRKVIAMYVLTPRAIIGRNPDKLYHFIDSTKLVVEQNLPLRWSESVQKAIRTAK